MNLVGKTLCGRYEVLEEVGVGGLATVYKAKCNLLNRFVAIKVLKDEFAKDQEFVKKFRAEAQSAAALTHPNIVSVYDVGEENGVNYIELLPYNQMAGAKYRLAGKEYTPSFDGSVPINMRNEIFSEYGIEAKKI